MRDSSRGYPWPVTHRSPSRSNSRPCPPACSARGDEHAEGVRGAYRREAVDRSEPRSQAPDHLGVVARGAGGGEDSLA